MSTIKTVFLGTPDFAQTILQALYDSELIDIIAVITQPDRSKGRKRKLQPPPVKILAQQYNTPVFQPEKMRKNNDLLESIQALQPQLGVVASFGQIIPKSFLHIPCHGMINVHASLLPRWRGASPIAQSILHGDQQTGISIMKVEQKLDAGPYLLQTAIDISSQDTTASLEEKLALLGSRLIIDAITLIDENKASWTDQPEHLVTYAPQLSKDDGHINWNQPAKEISQKIRAYYPWPGSFTTLNQQLLHILQAELSQEKIAPGEITTSKKSMLIGTADYALSIKELKLQGKKALPVTQFLAGYREPLTHVI